MISFVVRPSFPTFVPHPESAGHISQWGDYSPIWRAFAQTHHDALTLPGLLGDDYIKRHT